MYNTKAAKDIKNIIDRQEQAYKKIINFLEIKTPKNKIRYFLYPNEELKVMLMGDDGYAQAIYHNKTVHIVYAKNINPLGEHEDTHILSLPLGLSIGFFQEGLAEFLTNNRKWQGKDTKYWIKQALKKKIFPELKSIFSHKNWMKLPDEYTLYYYILASSFVGFLIKKFDKKKFILLYKKLNRVNSIKKNMNIFEDIYKLKIQKIEKEWHSEIVALTAKK